MATGLLGGSFDPIHHGHLIAAERAAEALGLDTVFLVPCARQPLKTQGPVAGGAERAAMIRLAIEAHPRFVLDTLELDRPGPSYTVDTLREIRARWPDERLLLLLGADAAAQLPHWKAVEDVIRLADVAVLSRPGAPEVTTAFVKQQVAIPAIEISASDIRARVVAGKSIRYLVPPPVADYIQEWGLYR